MGPGRRGQIKAPPAGPEDRAARSRRGSPMTAEPSPPPVLLSPEEVARLLSISRTRVYELAAQGQLESVAIGRSRRIVADSVYAMVARLRDGDVG